MPALNLDQFDAPIFRVNKSLGLWWVREECSFTGDGEHDEVLHGPFTDHADAFEQCGRPERWINEGPR